MNQGRPGPGELRSCQATPIGTQGAAAARQQGGSPVGSLVEPGARAPAPSPSRGRRCSTWPGAGEGQQREPGLPTPSINSAPDPLATCASRR